MAETLGPLNGEAQQASVHRGKVSREERSTQRIRAGYNPRRSQRRGIFRVQLYHMCSGYSCLDMDMKTFQKIDVNKDKSIIKTNNKSQDHIPSHRSPKQKLKQTQATRKQPQQGPPDTVVPRPIAICSNHAISERRQPLSLAKYEALQASVTSQGG